MPAIPWILLTLRMYALCNPAVSKCQTHCCQTDDKFWTQDSLWFHMKCALWMPCCYSFPPSGLFCSCLRKFTHNICFSKRIENIRNCGRYKRCRRRVSAFVWLCLLCHDSVPRKHSLFLDSRESKKPLTWICSIYFFACIPFWNIHSRRTKFISFAQFCRIIVENVFKIKLAGHFIGVYWCR